MFHSPKQLQDLLTDLVLQSVVDQLEVLVLQEFLDLEQVQNLLVFQEMMEVLCLSCGLSNI